MTGQEIESVAIGGVEAAVSGGVEDEGAEAGGVSVEANVAWG